MTTSLASELQITDARLRPIAEKVLAGERLTWPTASRSIARPICSPSAGLRIMFAKSVMAIFATTTSIATSIPQTFAWRIAAFAPLAAIPMRPALTILRWMKFIDSAAEGVRAGATEFHMVGGLHPDLPFEYFLDMIRGLKQRCPTVHLKAFTMVEVGYFSRIAKLCIREMLLALKEAGVDSLPGGGAEIFNPRVRRIICDHKTSGSSGWKSRASRTKSDCAQTPPCFTATSKTKKSASSIFCFSANCRTKRTDSSLLFRSRFIRQTQRSRILPTTTGYDDLRSIAVSRLLLDNFDHIKAYWVMMTPRIAQIALRFGADDIDGTIVEEKIYHDAGATTEQYTPLRELERLIRAAGRMPFERDTIYRPVTRTTPVPDLPPAGPGFVPSATLSLNV